jgi:hypothetical protein
MSDTKPVEKQLTGKTPLVTHATMVSQIEAAVQAEREAWIGTLRRLSDVCTDQEMAEVYEELIAAIRSRGEAVK